MSIRQGTPISIKVELDSADYSGEEAEWWVLVMIPDGEWYYFDYPLSQWRYAGSLNNPDNGFFPDILLPDHQPEK